MTKKYKKHEKQGKSEVSWLGTPNPEIIPPLKFLNLANPGAESAKDVLPHQSWGKFVQVITCRQL